MATINVYKLYYTNNTHTQMHMYIVDFHSLLSCHGICHIGAGFMNVGPDINITQNCSLYSLFDIDTRRKSRVFSLVFHSLISCQGIIVTLLLHCVSRVTVK